MSGSPLRWPTKQVCIKCPFTQDLSSSPTGLYIYIYIYIYLTIILRGRAGYQMIDNQRGA